MLASPERPTVPAQGDIDRQPVAVYGELDPYGVEIVVGAYVIPLRFLARAAVGCVVLALDGAALHLFDHHLVALPVGFADQPYLQPREELALGSE
jgi:hypothetical protein